MMRWAMSGIILWTLCACPSVAWTRGWCNTDHLGDSDLQGAVTKGSDNFYMAMSHVWDSFRETEDARYDKAIEAANSASASFVEAKDQYARAAEKVDEKTEELLTKVDLKALGLESTGTVNGPLGASLLVGCSN